MIISYFHNPNLKSDDNRRHSMIEPLLLLSVSLRYTMTKKWVILFSEDINKWLPARVIEYVKEIFSEDPNFDKVIANYEMLKNEQAKFKSVKNKSKRMLEVINAYNYLVNKLKKEILIQRTKALERSGMKELIPFCENGVWQLVDVDFTENIEKEHVFISEISNTFIEHERFLCLNEDVSTLLRFSSFDSSEDKEFDFIQIPLWEFPFLWGLNFMQLKYTRDNLQLDMVPFNLSLNELSEEIFNIPFNIETQTLLKQICKTRLEDKIEPIQHAIYNSLYVTQVRNKLGFNPHVRFCIGITSVENLINYYEKSETVLPYIADELKTQTARHIDLQSSYVFCYFQTYD